MTLYIPLPPNHWIKLIYYRVRVNPVSPQYCPQGHIPDRNRDLDDRGSDIVPGGGYFPTNSLPAPPRRPIDGQDGDAS